MARGFVRLATLAFVVVSATFTSVETATARKTPEEILHACARNLAGLRVVHASMRSVIIQSTRSPHGLQTSSDQEVVESYDRAATGSVAFHQREFPVSTGPHPLQVGRARRDDVFWVGGRMLSSLYFGPHFFEANISRRRVLLRDDIASAGCAVLPLLGILYGDEKPFPMVLDSQGMTLRLMRSPVMVGRYHCVVLKADGPAGAYSLWIDTHRGYALVRARVRKVPGNMFMGMAFGTPFPKPPKGVRVVVPRIRRETGFTLKLGGVVLATKAGIWFPQQCRWEFRMTHRGGAAEGDFIRCRVRALSLMCSPTNPAFNPDIPEGASVVDSVHPAIRYVWHKGKAVPAYDKTGIKQINRRIDDLRAQATKPNISPATLLETPQPPRAAAAMARGGFTGDPVASSDSLWIWVGAAGISVVGAAVAAVLLRKHGGGR